MAVYSDVNRPLERRRQIYHVDSTGDRGQLVILEVEGWLRVDVGHVEIDIAGTIQVGDETRYIMLTSK